MSDSELHLMLPKRQRPIWEGGDLLAVEAAAMVEIPLLGWVAAGMPVEALQQRETVAVPAGMVRKDCYALRVRGDSMIEDNIQDGDVIVIERRRSAENGQSVVALINGENVTLKRFYIEKGGVRLQPANSSMAPIFLRNDEIEILGIVMGVIRTP